MIVTIIQILFILIAVGMIVSAFFPSWNFNAGPVVAASRLFGLAVALVILVIIYLLIMMVVGHAVV